MPRASLEDIASTLIDSGAVGIRDVDGGEQPYVYTSGACGPIYHGIKHLVSQREVLDYLTKNLSYKISELSKERPEVNFDFIVGTATGGMIPGWQLSSHVADMLQKNVPFCYWRTKNKRDPGEIVGKNPLLTEGMSALVFDDVINFAKTTMYVAKTLTDVGYSVSHVACILSYDHQASKESLKENGIDIIPLITMRQLLEVAEAHNFNSKKAIESCREFLSGPYEWQLKRGFPVPSYLDLEAQKRNPSYTPPASTRSEERRLLSKVHPK